MTPLSPVTDVLVYPDGGAWRIIFAPTWSDPPILTGLMGDDREVCPVGRPDFDALDRYMWERDAPYHKELMEDGGAALFAKGRGGEMLALWVAELIAAGAAQLAPAP